MSMLRREAEETVCVCVCVCVCLHVGVPVLCVHMCVNETGKQICRCLEHKVGQNQEPSTIGMKRTLEAMIVAEINISTIECSKSLAVQGKWLIYFTFLRCMSGPTALNLEALRLKGYLEVEEKQSEHIM